MVHLTHADAARFYEKVERRGHGGHWIWIGGTRGDYGAFSVGGKTYAAHRISFMLATGRDPGKKKLLHSCDITLCVHPKHLIAGTQRENVDDMLTKNRHAYGDRNGSRKHPERVARGERAGAAKLSTDDVMRIREQRAQGMSVSDIAHRWDVNKSTISRILTGKQWKHL